QTCALPISDRRTTSRAQDGGRPRPGQVSRLLSDVIRGEIKKRCDAFAWTQGPPLLHASRDPMASPPKRPDAASGGTLIDGEDDASSPPQASVDGDGPGSTAVVRVDRAGPKSAPLPPTRRAESAPAAPKQGLQLSLPVDE